MTRCHKVSVGGGLWEEEIKWEIRKVTLGQSRGEMQEGTRTVKGSAPETCQFGLPNYYGELPCLVTCGVYGDIKTHAPTPSQLGIGIASFVPSDAPSMVPSLAKYED